MSKIGQIKAADLTATQPERVHRLQQRRVAHRRGRPLVPPAPDIVDPAIGRVEQCLHLVVGQRAATGPALELGGVDHRVPPVQHHRRCPPELAHTRGRPSVPRVADELDEQPQRHLVAAQRRQRQRPLTRPQPGEECLDLGAGPLPWVQAAELVQPTHQRVAGPHRVRRQSPGALLPRPAHQHPREHRSLRVQVRDVIDQRQVRGTR